MQETLADVLSEYVQRAHYSSGKLAKMTGLSRKSITNWLDGTVNKPHQWQVLVKLAAVLHLNESETSRLLRSARYPTVTELWQTVNTTEDYALLAPWPLTPNVPFQAIYDLPYFVGREDKLSEITEALQQRGNANVCTVWGMGGVGKTSVAAHLAYQLRALFPDGVLWANLATSNIMTILSLFAQTFGEDVNQQTDVNNRSTYVRGILANKHVLIILDDAQNSKQLELLLPPNTGKTAVIITTRYDLSAVDGFKRVKIEPFSPNSGDSLNIFTYFLGQPVVKRNKTHLTEIANLLGHLPLAISIAAARLAYGHTPTIADFLNQIQQQENRLDQLTRSPEKSVRLSFDMSYQTLSSELQELFAILGVFGGENFNVEAVTAVAQKPKQFVTDNFHQLTRLSLLRQEPNHRYSLHPLLRDYAREKINQNEIWERMVHYYAAYTHQHEFDPPALSSEINNIIAALQSAYEQKLNTYLTESINILYPFLEVRGLHETAVHHLNQALQLTQTNNQTTETALLLSHLAHQAYIRANYDQAETYLQTSLDLAGNSSISSHLLYNLAAIQVARGHSHQAETNLTQALILARQNGNTGNLSDILSLLGTILASTRGEYTPAEAYLQEAYDLAQQIGDKKRLCDGLIRLGSLAYHRGYWSQAEMYYQQGLALAEQTGNLRAEMNILHNLGAIAESQGLFEQAEAHLQNGLAIAEKIDLKEMIVLTTTNLGEVTLKQGKVETAQKQLQHAVSVARIINHPANLGYALVHLGAAFLANGNHITAEPHLREGLEIALHHGHLWDKCVALRWWGELLFIQEEFEAAQATWNQAKELAEITDTQELLGIILFRLAQLEQIQGNVKEAISLGQDSLVILEKLGHYLYDKINGWLNHLKMSTII